MAYYASAISTITWMALALGMDAFSAALGFGCYKIRIKKMIILGITVGIFHALMPFIGVLLGKYVSDVFGRMATVASGILLCLLGLQMLIFSIIKRNEDSVIPSGVGIIIFAFSVSLDSFSVGLSLGMIGLRAVVSLMLFGLAATLLTWAGLFIGRNFHQLLGIYSRILGSVILLLFGIKIILS